MKFWLRKYLWNSNTIQHILQNIRTRHNLTQVEFAEQIFVSRQTVSNWERGISIPPVAALTIIAKTFNMPLPEIVSALEGQQTDKTHTAERQLLVDAFCLCYIVTMVCTVTLILLSKRQALHITMQSNYLIHHQPYFNILPNNLMLKSLPLYQPVQQQILLRWSLIMSYPYYMIITIL